MVINPLKIVKTFILFQLYEHGAFNFHINFLLNFDNLTKYIWVIKLFFYGDKMILFCFIRLHFEKLHKITFIYVPIFLS